MWTRKWSGTLEAKLHDKGIELTHIAYDQEHSLEIELPFLQRALDGDFKLLPLMVRSNDPAELETLADAFWLTCWQMKPCLLVGSTDLSHFHSEELAQRIGFRNAAPGRKPFPLKECCKAEKSR